MRPTAPGVALFTVACLAATTASAQVVRQEVPGIRNFAKVESTVACAGAITPAAIQEIKNMGYASIINLRQASETGADVEGEAAAAFDQTLSGQVSQPLVQPAPCSKMVGYPVPASQ